MRFLLYAIAILVSTSVWAQTSDVDWTHLRDADLLGTTLSRSSSANNTATAISRQVSFGRGNSSVFGGYLEFIPNSLTEEKKIGFTDLSNPDFSPKSPAYGFFFRKNGKVRCYSDGDFVNLDYNPSDVFRLERDGNQLRYKINGIEVFSVRVNRSRDLNVLAALRSNGSSFSNVVVDFNTTNFIVLPTIDHANKTIALSISGAHPPYKFVWDTGMTGNDISRTTSAGAKTTPFFKNGNYRVTIIDGLGDITTRIFSIGDSPVWTDFYNTTATGSDLIKSTPNKWGSAKHNTAFSEGSSAWLEHIIDISSSGRRAFGFSDESQSILRIQQLKAGFYISNNALQVIKDGDVVASLEYKDQDVLNIRYDGGALLWYLNGEKVYSDNYTSGGEDIDIVGLVHKNATLSKLVFDLNPATYATPLWNALTDSGEITVDISAISGAQAPYHYVISEKISPELKDVYSILKDSINYPVDSTAFFTGDNSMTTNTFTGLIAGRYHVSVFDSRGDRIFGKFVDVQDDLTLETSNGYTVVGNAIQSTQNNAVAVLELYTVNGEDAEVFVEQSRVLGNDEQFMGWADLSGTVTDENDIQYGFYIDNRRLYTIEAGVISTESVRLRRASELGLRIENGEISYLYNGSEIQRVTAPVSYEYRYAMGSAQLQNAQIQFGLASLKKKVRPRMQILTNLACENGGTPQAGSFSVSVNLFANLSGSTVTYDITNITTGEVVVSSGTYNSNQSNVFSTLSNGDPLTAGIYQLSGTVNGGNNPQFTATICLGYEAEWAQDLSGYAQSPNSYSLLRNVPTSSTYSYARAKNIETSGEGWVSFEPTATIGAGFTAGHLMRFDYSNFGMPVLATSSGPNLVFLPWFNGDMLTIFIDDQSFGSQFFDQGDEFKISFINNTATVEVEGSPWQTFSTNPNFDWIGVNAQSLAENSAFENVITSFSCSPQQPASTIDHAELEKELDGGHALVVEGQLKFTFDEEYPSPGSFIEFAIYDQQRLIVASSDIQGITTGGISAEPYQSGDSRYELDMSTTSASTGEFYTLEVITQKGDKKYLKFFYKN